MTSNELYEEVKQRAFNKIRHQRDAHAPYAIETDPDALEPLKLALFGIKDRNAQSYSWVMKESEEISINMFKEILEGLLNKYNIPYEVVKYNKRTVHPEPVIAFITKEDKTLYVITTLRTRRLQREALVSFFLSYGAKDIKLVTMVHDYAYRLRLDYNDDESDPSRGTGLFSIRYLFETLFGAEEYECFKTFEQTYSKEIRKYLGYQVIKTLTPNALYGFKKTVEDSLLTFPYRDYISELATTTIPSPLLDAIEKQFIGKKYYKALIGKKEYAQSFVTAEWLYDTMKSAGRIDYTAVAMGYFKAVEQLMFELVRRHVGEGRTIRKKRGGGFDDLTQAKLNADMLDTTLGALIGFFKYYQNRDLFIPEIRADENAQNGILSIIDLAREDRNGYFHKDNIDVWDKIEEARILSYLILALLLGAYEYSDQDRVALNIPEENAETDYYKLCEYINYNADQLFYLSLNGDDIIPVFAAADDDMEINEYGDPKFSGIYFRKIYGVGSERIEISAVDIVRKHTVSTGDNERYSEDSLPAKIYTGQMTPGKIGMVYSGPLTLIYENGRYMLPKQVFHVGY